MEENKVLNDDRLDEVVGGLAQRNFGISSVLDEGAMVRILAVQNMTQDAFLALTPEERAKLLSDFQKNVAFDAVQLGAVPDFVHGMEPFL